MDDGRVDRALECDVRPRRDEVEEGSPGCAERAEHPRRWSGTCTPLRSDGQGLYRAAITSLAFMSMVMVHPEVPLNSNGAGLGPRR